jgi:hypothetical protein
MDTTEVLEQDTVTLTLSCEQYRDLLNSLEAVGRDMHDLVKVEAVVNFYRDQQNLHTPLGEVLRELNSASPSQDLWQRQAEFKRRDLTFLIGHLRKTLTEGCLV